MTEGTRDHPGPNGRGHGLIGGILPGLPVKSFAHVDIEKARGSSFDGQADKDEVQQLVLAARRKGLTACVFGAGHRYIAVDGEVPPIIRLSSPWT